MCSVICRKKVAFDIILLTIPTFPFHHTVNSDFHLKSGEWVAEGLQVVFFLSIYYF